MRGLLILVVAACGSNLPPQAQVSPTSPGVPARPATAIDKAPIDPIAALAPADRSSLLQPGAIQLELHTTPIEGPGPSKPLPVTIIGDQGSRVRVAIRLDHARFVVWTERARLLSVLQREERVAPAAGRSTMSSEPHVALRPGAPVRRLARGDKWTQVRYSGAVEVEGWLPDLVLADSAPAGASYGRIPSGRRTLMVTPGTVIRAEPKWGGRQLAVMASGYFVDTVRELDDGWVEVAYADSDVRFTGFVSKRDPPGRLHRKHLDPALAPVPITPNTKVASGTCLHAHADGDPIGYLVGDQDVDLADAGSSWWNLAINTPWGSVVFAARGPDPTSLAACAPKDSVPASTLIAPPTAP